MRVTQTMLSRNTLGHINQGYNRLANIQDQLATGKKITRASQDPVVAMKGMRYRSQVTEVEQFKRNLREVYNWMDTADATIDKGTEALQRIRELATQAANDTYDSSERANIAQEIKQLREHLQSLANTKNSNKYIFNGTDTTNAPIVDMKDMDLGAQSIIDGTIPPNTVDVIYDGRAYKLVNDDGNGTLTFQDSAQTMPAFGDADFDEKARQIVIDQNNGSLSFSEANPKYDPNDPMSPKNVKKSLRQNDIVVAKQNAVSINEDPVEIELLKGVSIPVNINPSNIFNNTLFGDIIRLERALEDSTVKGEDLSGFINNFAGHLNNMVSERAELGARVNRVEMIENRIMEQEVTANRILSDNEDADMEKVIIDLTTQESVHRAALSSGARIMQPTLLDFLR
ncbi:flagellar hook-associated protein FlgL [Halalkalibacter urbisdiaboli]|uniref:flagellar hook-associated protein FlgL n=1 Tax=Halalkalibacter urbisdiaboli TaxID=1960589 RepID=UPI000B4546E2|nr:flagellar hook-associated protein FlgL [Halalkalibacter urbisdiaboli]